MSLLNRSLALPRWWVVAVLTVEVALGLFTWHGIVACGPSDVECGGTTLFLFIVPNLPAYVLLRPFFSPNVPVGILLLAVVGSLWWLFVSALVRFIWLALSTFARPEERH